ncbi:hypothetical protein CAEBREN_18812 [Caenorhabditis brenneri]|uniref:Smr domain-containing protein n=1 Tax=Caenorhabditis brenneri TaxID=135651 RepID=G0NL42_CAEBE|nr:hypothetical protein CAEBREN_18812 [Caenorhabditis brenneri]
MNAVRVNDYDAIRELAKAMLKEKIAVLYTARQQAFDANDYKMAGEISNEVNMSVIDFNLAYPKEDKYLDLHYMTEKGAVNFVAMMCHGNQGIWKLETGRGNNSPGKIPVIKRKLFEIYEGSIWIDKNEGILLLKVL